MGLWWNSASGERADRWHLRLSDFDGRDHMRSGTALVLTILLSTIAILCIGCSDPWRRACEVNTVEAYREYVRNRRLDRSHHTWEAKRRICELAWAQACSLGTEHAFATLLDECPECLYIQLAAFDTLTVRGAVDRKIRGIKLRRVEEEGTREACLAFLDSHDEVRKVIGQLIHPPAVQRGNAGWPNLGNDHLTVNLAGVDQAALV